MKLADERKDHAVDDRASHQILRAVFRDEVWAALREAGSISVRDRITRGILIDAGIDAALIPDPVTRIAEHYAPLIRSRIQRSDPYLALSRRPVCCRVRR